MTNSKNDHAVLYEIEHHPPVPNSKTEGAETRIGKSSGVSSWIDREFGEFVENSFPVGTVELFEIL